jgi:hypothetical protein
MIGGPKGPDRVFLIVILNGDGVFSELVSNLHAVHGANGSQTAPVVLNEQYALGTAPRTK